MNIELHMACNDPASGTRCETCDRVELFHNGESLLHIEGDPVRCVREGVALTIGKHTLGIRGYCTWVGNWCWDAATVIDADAVTVVQHLRREGWTVESGLANIVDAYEAGVPLWNSVEAAMLPPDVPPMPVSTFATNRSDLAALAAWNAGEPRRVG